MRAYRKIDEGYEFKVEGGRLVLFGVGAFLTLALVFLVGVLVGKGLWGARNQGITPLVQGTAGSERPTEPSRRQYTFYEDLKRPDVAGQPPPPEGREARDAASETPIPAPAPGQEATTTPAESASTSAENRAGVKALPSLFTVQVGSFRDRSAADDQVRRIGSQGIGSQVVPVSVEGRTWYRVQVGKFGTRADAEAYYQKRLRPRGVQGFVTAR